jgi:hypothetical protein
VDRSLVWCPQRFFTTMSRAHDPPPSVPHTWRRCVVRVDGFPLRPRTTTPVGRHLGDTTLALGGEPITCAWACAFLRCRVSACRAGRRYGCLKISATIITRGAGPLFSSQCVVSLPPEMCLPSDSHSTGCFGTRYLSLARHRSQVTGSFRSRATVTSANLSPHAVG